MSYRLPKITPSGTAGVYIWGVAVEILTIVFALWGGTQYIAWKFHYAAALGTPILKLPLIPLYAPWLWPVWMWQFWATPGTEDWWTRAFDIFLFAHVAPVLSFGVYLRRESRYSQETDKHGSGHFQNDDEIRKGPLLNNDGVYLGAWRDK